MTGDLVVTCREFADRTRDYWTGWVRRLASAYDWQDAIIRAAISLKLSNFEETGGIVAALTTSIPEAPGSGRTWDYRYCWLRDAYFVVKALNRLGASKTMEGFISFILGIAAEETLRPVYGVVPDDSLGGDDRHRPGGLSRRRAGAHRQRRGRSDPARHVRQHHSRGDADVLRPAPAASGRRKPVQLCWSRSATRRPSSPSSPMPASGSIAGAAQVHTYSAAMCWAGCSRLAAIASHLGLHRRAANWTEIADGCRATLLERAWNEKRGAFTAGFGVDDLDASVLLLPEIGLIEPTDPRFVSTVAAIEKDLRRGQHMMRYASRGRFRHAGSRVPHLPVLADRRVVVARAAGGGARAVRRRAAVIAIAMGCWPRTSIRRPASCGAISRRPIRWRG